MKYLIFLFALFCQRADAQQMVRLAKIEVDSTHLSQYKSMLDEEIRASIALEKGVLTLFAVFERRRPAHLTILEIYADSAAYRSHIRTPHFLKYKNETEKWVKSLELVEVDPLISNMKIK